MECFTPNCVDGKSVRSIIKKVEVFNNEALIKATREIQEDDPVKYVKPAATPKGAIKKQQVRRTLETWKNNHVEICIVRMHRNSLFSVAKLIKNRTYFQN